MNNKLILFILSLVILSSLAFALTFDSKADAEDYVNSLKSYDKLSIEIVDVESRLNSGSEEVFWKATIYKQSQKTEKQCTMDEKSMKEICKDVSVLVTDVLHSETLSSTVSSIDSDAEVKSIIRNHATQWQKVWAGQQTVKARQGLKGYKEVIQI